MKKITTPFFLILYYTSFGQTVFSGKVVDSSKNPIPFCNVLLIDTNYSQNYVGGATDENGYFEIETNFRFDYSENFKCWFPRVFVRKNRY